MTDRADLYLINMLEKAERVLKMTKSCLRKSLDCDHFYQELLHCLFNFELRKENPNNIHCNIDGCVNDMETQCFSCGKFICNQHRVQCYFSVPQYYNGRDIVDVVIWDYCDKCSNNVGIIKKEKISRRYEISPNSKSYTIE